MATQFIGSPPGLEDRASVQTVQCSVIDLPYNLQGVL